MDSNSTINQNYKFEFNIDNSNENNIYQLMKNQKLNGKKLKMWHNKK